MHAIYFSCVAPIHCDLFLETTAAFDKTLVLARGDSPFMMMLLLAVARTDLDLTCLADMVRWSVWCRGHAVGRNSDVIFKWLVGALGQSVSL